MKKGLHEIIPSLFITMLILIVFEIISTAFLPLIGMTTYRIPFNILIVLFLGFKLESPFIAILILLIQYVHSFFAIEGWAMGTVAGVMICILISYVRELLHFSSATITILVTQIFQTVWFIITASLLYIRNGNFDYFLPKLWRFIPESIIISLLAPFCFSLLDRVWKISDHGMLGRRKLMFGEDDLVKDHKPRADLIGNLVLIAFTIILARLWFLQIYKGELLYRYSLENRLRKEIIRAPRGMIFSRNNEQLVHNIPRFDVVITPQYLKNRQQSIQKLATILDMESEEISSILKRNAQQASYRQVVIKKNISRKEVAIIETEGSKLPGISVATFISREYTDKQIGGHMLGYISEISKAQLPNYRKRDNFDYRLGDFIGQAGIEEQHDLDLRGVDGQEYMEVDASGRMKHHIQTDNLFKGIENIPAISGHNIRLTIDRDLQLAAYNALENKTGSTIAIDVNTGEILAMVSRPSFDPTQFSRGLSSELWNYLTNHEHNPLRDRNIQEHYPPGSTFKVVTAIAALEEGIVDESTEVHCSGRFRIGRTYKHCWKRRGHGKVNIYRAIKESCDTFFYKIATQLDIDIIARYARLFGLGAKTGVNLPRETSGLIPTKEWKKKRDGLEWQIGETLSCAIGQSYILTTPIQMVLTYATIANGGTLYHPTLVKEIFSNSGEIKRKIEPQVVTKLELKEQTLNILRKSLYMVVNEKDGTGWYQRARGFKMAGKTGTAQVAKITEYRRCEEQPYRLRDHALFIGYAPAQDPKIAVAAVVEHGCHGSSVAAPIVREIITTYMDKYYPEIRKQGLAQERKEFLQQQREEEQKEDRE